jgi:hypothetical protein
VSTSDSLGEAWSEFIPTSHREALSTAFDSLCDGFFDEQGDLPFTETYLGSLLPMGFRHHYTDGFGRRFFLCITTLGWKLAQPREFTPSCVAEELSLRILVTEAEGLLEEDGVKAEFGTFEDVYLQDADVELLYNLAFDGIEDSETGDELGLDHLRFENWFKPFLNATTAVHPYSA